MDQRQRLEVLAEAVVPEAVAWVDELRRYRVYQGKDLDYFRKARVGVGVISNAVRLCATVENSRTNDAIERRMAASPARNRRQLTEGDE
jgi:hypothetical protein